MNSKQNPSILEANIFFFTLVILFILVGSYVQSTDFNAGILITEFILIFAPVIFYLGYKGYNINKILRLNKISFKQAILTPLIVISSYPVAIFINFIMIMILSYFGKIIPNPIPLPESSNDFIIGIFVVSLSAGICEEILFRGMLLSSYERLGKLHAILLTGILFGLMHLNIQNLLGPIFLGILFGYLTIKTNSIFIAIIAHSTNNFIAWGLSFLVNKLSSVLPNTNNTVIIENLSGLKAILTFIPSLIIIGIFAVIGALISILLIKLLPKSEDAEIKEFNYEISKKTFISFIPVFIVLIIYIFFTYNLLSKI